MEVVCRLCGDKKPQSQIKCSIEDQDLNIEQKLIDCCRWQLYQSYDNLPQDLCIECFQQLQRCWEFAEKVSQAQQKLIDNLTECCEMKSQDPFDVTVKSEFQVNNDSNDSPVEPWNEPDDWNENHSSSSNENLSFHAKMEECADEETSNPVEIEEYDKPINGKQLDPNAKNVNSNYFMENDEDEVKKKNQKITNEATERWTPGNISFPDCLSADDRNTDGTVKIEAITNFGLVTWTMLQNRCNECEASFITSVELQRHHKLRHTSTAFRFRCWFCNESAENKSHYDKSSLKRHIVRCHVPHLEYWLVYLVMQRIES